MNGYFGRKSFFFATIQFYPVGVLVGLVFNTLLEHRSGDRVIEDVMGILFSLGAARWIVNNFALIVERLHRLRENLSAYSRTYCLPQ